MLVSEGLSQRLIEVGRFTPDMCGAIPPAGYLDEKEKGS